MLDLRIELLKFLSCIMSRVNLTNPRLPSHLKLQAVQCLEESNVLLSKYLFQQTDSANDEQELVYYLDCYYTCGLVYLIMYRYSITSTSYLTNATSANAALHSNACLDELNTFLHGLNTTFKLLSRIDQQIDKNTGFKLLFYLVEFFYFVNINLAKKRFNFKIFRIKCSCLMCLLMHCSRMLLMYMRFVWLRLWKVLRWAMQIWLSLTALTFK